MARVLDCYSKAIELLSDSLDPTPRELPVKPHDGPQRAFIESDCDEIFYGGARGGGKSFGFLLDFLNHESINGPNARGLLIRRQFTDLKDIMLEASSLFARVGAVFRHPSTWIFPSGSVLRFSFMKSEMDAEKYLGHAYTWIGVEEAGTYSEFSVIKKLKACLRSSSGVKVRLVLNSNPGGRGHNWLKARYIDPAPPNTKMIEYDEELGIEWSRIFIPATLSDNPSLMNNDPHYPIRIKGSAPEYLVKAWLLGDWNITAGGRFDHLFTGNRNGMIVCKPFPIPDHWPIERSFDWGYSKPFSVGWFTTSDGSVIADDRGNRVVFPSGSKILVAEWYGCNQDTANNPNRGIELVASEIAKGIRDREEKYFNGRVYGGVADSAIWVSSGVGTSQSIADEMAMSGITFNPSAKGAGSRVSGWQVMERMLLNSIEGNGDPGLYISESCRHWLRTVPSVARDDSNLDDVDTDSEDHCADMTRYFLTTPSNSFTMEDWRV